MWFARTRHAQRWEWAEEPQLLFRWRGKKVFIRYLFLAAAQGPSESRLLSLLLLDAKGNKPFQDKAEASEPGSYKNVAMVGQEVYKFAVRSVPQVRRMLTGNHV